MDRDGEDPLPFPDGVPEEELSTHDRQENARANFDFDSLFLNPDDPAAGRYPIEFPDHPNPRLGTLMSIFQANSFTNMLIRLLVKGKYDDAERFLLAKDNIENLINDNYRGATPLNFSLSDTSDIRSRTKRSLKMAKLLVMHGANPNLHVMPTVFQGNPVSPFEQLVNFYLEIYTKSESEDVCDQTIGIDGETDVPFSRLVPQCEELIRIFLGTLFLLLTSLILLTLDQFFSDHGADPNFVPRTQTIFHQLLVKGDVKWDILRDFINKGAHINITDVHGSSPFMDVVASTDNAAEVYAMSLSMGQDLRLDVQNCVKESALYRAYYYGKPEVVNMILNINDPDNMIKFGMARILRSRMLQIALPQNVGGSTSFYPGDK